MKDTFTKPGWIDIEEGCRHIANSMSESQPGIHYVVGITRGGLIPAVIISHLLNIPAVTVSYSSISGSGNDKFYNNILPDIQSTINVRRIISGPLRLLIVDDICDSGKTIGDVSSAYAKQGHEVFTATLYYKNGSEFSPNFYWQKIMRDKDWITFPWEFES